MTSSTTSCGRAFRLAPSSIGFIKIAGMAVTNQAQSQLLLWANATEKMMRLAAGQTADGAETDD